MAAERGTARSRQAASQKERTLEPVAGQGGESTLGLDRIIHERVRLGIVSALAVNGSLTFTELKQLLGATDGNLSAHARRLEEAGYVLCHKTFEDRTPRTAYRLSKEGRGALEAYLEHMEAIIQATRVG